MIAIGIVYTPLFARLVRSQALTIRELDYCLAARTLGAGPLRMMFRHIWPNATAPIIVQASLLGQLGDHHRGVALVPGGRGAAADAVLGLDLERRLQGTWRSRRGWRSRRASRSSSPCSALNFLGDGLRTALDPRMSRRGS